MTIPAGLEPALDLIDDGQRRKHYRRLDNAEQARGFAFCRCSLLHHVSFACPDPFGNSPFEALDSVLPLAYVSIRTKQYRSVILGGMDVRSKQ
jgi:hypothetical protein